MRTIIFFSCLILLAGSAAAQMVSMGPIDIVVDNTSVGTVIYSGSGSAAAGEGSAGTVTLSVSGPIAVNPTSVSLTGPPCPTWVGGKRQPETPAYNNGSWEPEVTLKQAVAPGTMSEASITADYNGHWSHCNEAGEVPVTASGLITFHIYGINVTISGNTKGCAGEILELQAIGYPEGGSCQWSAGTPSGTNTVKLVLSESMQLQVTYTNGGKTATASAQIDVTQWDQTWHEFKANIPGDILNKIASVKSLTKSIVKKLPGSIQLEGPEVTISGKVRDCCDKDNTIKNGEKSVTGKVSGSIGVKNLPLAPPPWSGTYKCYIHKFGYEFGVEFSYGILLTVQATLEGSVTYNRNECTNKGCFIYDAGINLDMELAAKLAGDVGIKSSSRTWRCRGTTQAGTRCQHMTRNICRYCFQHVDQSRICSMTTASFELGLMLNCPASVHVNYDDCSGSNYQLCFGPASTFLGLKLAGYDLGFNWELTKQHCLP